jgi:hypothetical protein
MTARELPQAQSTRFSWGFLRNWVLAGTIGWGVSYFALWAVAMIASSFARGLGEGFLFLASLPTIVVVVSILQWLVMRRRISCGGGWVLAAMVGSLLWTLAFHYSRGVLPKPAQQLHVVRLGMILLYVAGAGASIGALQWVFVLRRQVPRAYWWVLASSLGWALAPLEWMWDFDFGSGMVAVVVRRALLGTLFGIVTGVCVIQLLRATRRGMPGSEEVAG